MGQSEAGRRVVVLTGAAGRIGRAVLPRLPGAWDVRSTDLAAGSAVSRPDVTDRRACTAAFAGADAVVHLAAVPDPRGGLGGAAARQRGEQLRRGQAAVDAGVRRLVLASSLQAVSAVPLGTQVRADDPPRPANLYGATKAWAQALGSWVAATSTTSVVALRIGAFQVERPDSATASARDRAAWLSARDAADLVRAAVEADVRFLVVNGISANRHRQADLEATTVALGYRPLDDAWA